MMDGNGFRAKLMMGVLALGCMGAGAYAVHEHNAAKAAAAQNEQIAASLKSTNAQLEQLTAKLNEMAAAKPAQAAAAKRTAARPQRRSSTRMVRMADGRWQKIESRLDEQGRALEATRADLANTRTELQGSIARTHDELVVLQRKGERHYYEFDVLKSKEFRTHGPVGIKLKKANTKKQYADLELMVDDVKLQKKHVNLYEPAMFYTGTNEQPIAVVINQITKDRIHGYISTPKYRPSELAAMSQGAQQGQGTEQGLKTRQTLPVPK
ncbi:MAG TPA: hypothetical protein VEG32_03775 [Clostridia bacterium]|nr:hypothetical protein [Clostridia bacterium]